MMHRQIETILANQEVRKFFLYALCGGTSVLVDFSLYAGLLYAGIGYQAANFAGYFLGTLASFSLNRHFTFKAYDKTLRRLALFFSTAGIGYAVSILMLWALVEKYAVNPLVAKLLTLFVVLVIQFSLNRSITFRTSEEEQRS